MSSSSSGSSSSDPQDKTAWRSRFFAGHPEVLELTERLYPLSRACSLAREYKPPGDSRADREADEHSLLTLIALHLSSQGCKHAAVLLGRQLGIPLEQQSSSTAALMRGDRLISILRLALQDSEKIWDLTISDKGLSAEQNSLELQDHLGQLGLLTENIDRDDNIWSEPPGNVVYDETASSAGPSKIRQIKAASLNRLVLQLTSSDAADLTFQKTFLMTYRLFTTSITLLRKLIQRYDVPAVSLDDGSEAMEESEIEARRLAIQTRACNVMKQWIGDYFEIDFNNHTLRTELKAFIERLKQEGSGLARNVESVLIRVSMGAPVKDSPASAGQSRSGAPDPRVPNNVFSPTLRLGDVEEEEVARQLTLMEFQTFANIQPVELLNQAWGSKHLKHRAPYVTAMISRFNQISNWVSYSILSAEKLRDRVRTYTRFIKIAEHLRNMNNFQTFQAILAAFSSTPIHRLKVTQATLDPRLLQKVEEWNDLMKGDQSYRQVRLALASIKPPAIPYIGIFLKDIVFIADGNPDLTAEGLINYNKYRLLYSVISQIQQFQQESYNFHFVEQIANHIVSLKFYDEDTLYNMSLKCEGRIQ